MKKFLLGLLLVVPFSVNAMATSETFDVGNEVIVALKEGDTEQTGGRAFHVLKPSAAGEETVTLIFDGTADEKTMLNYNNRTIEPIVSAFVDAMKRSFLSKTARTQGQTIMAFRDPFKLVPINNIAEIADKFTRNEILTSNEIRQIIGFKPSSDPKADQLVNSNIAQPAENQAPMEGEVPMTDEEMVDDETTSNGVTGSGQESNIADMPISQLMTMQSNS